LAEGVEAETETLDHIFPAIPLDEDSAKGLVETLGVVLGLEKEKATSVVVHVSVSGCEELLSLEHPETIE
jgi:hypothetical protein